MSRATCIVRFPNGTLRYATYDGTSDVVASRLMSREAWDHHIDFTGTFPPSSYGGEEGERSPVEIATNYGRGFWWEGWATGTHVCPGFTRPYDDTVDGSYDGEPRHELHRGLPEWWPSG